MESTPKAVEDDLYRLWCAQLGETPRQITRTDHPHRLWVEARIKGMEMCSYDAFRQSTLTIQIRRTKEIYEAALRQAEHYKEQLAQLESELAVIVDSETPVRKH